MKQSMKSITKWLWNETSADKTIKARREWIQPESSTSFLIKHRLQRCDDDWLVFADVVEQAKKQEHEHHTPDVLYPCTYDSYSY